MFHGPGRRAWSSRDKVVASGLALAAGILLTAVVSSSGHANSVHQEAPASRGYWLVSPSGLVAAYGGAKSLGSVAGLASGNRAVAIAATPGAGGYWVVTSQGAVYAFGDARYQGGLVGLFRPARPGAPIVGISAAVGGEGYRLVDALGQVYSFGDAHFYGPRGPLGLSSPVASIVANPRGGGYWLVAGNGRVLAFGDAHVYGSPPGPHGVLATDGQVVGMAATPDGYGYWLATTGGRVYAFGDAHNYGSAPKDIADPVVGIAATPDGGGYWLVGQGGTVWRFGDALGQPAHAAELATAPRVAGIATTPPPIGSPTGPSMSPKDHAKPTTTTRAATPGTTTTASTTTSTLPGPGPTTMTATSTSTTTGPTTTTVSSSTTIGSTTTTSAPATTTATVPPNPSAQTVPGESYQLCTDPTAQAEYLTSPWTYDGLASGSQSYTVSQYEALPGYGTTLPPLPSYIADEPPATEAAVIYAPTTSAIGAPGYGIPGTPVLFFFEGGAYGPIGFPSVSGDIFVGGSAPGFPEATFNNQGTARGIGDTTSHYGFLGGQDTGTGLAGSATLTVTSGGEQANAWLTFADGSNYQVASVSGTTLTLKTALTTSKNNARFWYNNLNSANGGNNQLGELSASAPQGSTQVSVGGWSGRPLGSPIVAGETLVLGDSSDAGTYLVDSVTGSQSGSYELTLGSPLSTNVEAGMPVWYADVAGGVTVQYLNIQNDVHSTDGTLTAGPYWTIEHNDIHDGYAGGLNYLSTSAEGIAISGADHATIAYNCFERMGEYALNGGGVGTKFDYNQVDETPYQPDLSGNGQSGCGKWWGSFNNDVVGNAFTDERYSVCVWFDNGNAGMLVQGNYFYDIAARAVQNETGWNSEYIGNLFEDVSGGIYLNDSGGWDIPGSRYNNEVLIQGNTFDNALEAINIWGASGRSCLNSGEAEPNGDSAPYCSGGFPQMPPAEQYFSHYHDSTVGAVATIVDNEDCSPSSPCSSLTLSQAVALHDRIGFAGQAPDNCTSSSPCGSYTGDPVSTSTADTANVSTLNGSGTINVASTAGFPPHGELLVSTSAGSLSNATGAVVSYTADTNTTFTGVTLVSGSGTLTGAVEAVQPYQVTAVSCLGGNCADGASVTVSPPLTGALAAGTAVYSTGTCPYYVTSTSTPSSPVAPNGTSYYDGCMWENRNISVTGNTFEVDPTQFDATPLPEGTGNWSCTTGPGGNCAQNAMGYQYPGGDAAPYNNVALANAIMSDSSFPSPLDNLNASGSPLATGAYGDVGPNGAVPYNDLWSANTYEGDWTFQAYTQAAACPLNWDGAYFQWVGTGGGGNACSGLSLAQWQSIWHQD
jgi:hypothetical protein